LASEYGWAKNEIENHVYFDELVYLVEKINRRKLREYKMQLAISQNAWVENPKELWRILESETSEESIDEKLDKAGFEAFKQKLSTSKNISVKSK